MRTSYTSHFALHPCSVAASANAIPQLIHCARFGYDHGPSESTEIASIYPLVDFSPSKASCAGTGIANMSGCATIAERYIRGVASYLVEEPLVQAPWRQFN